MNKKDFELRALVEKDKDIIYNWRNLEHIRVNMYNNQLIPYEDHCRWFKDVLNEQLEYYRLFMYRGKPLGLISFKEDRNQDLTCVWGLYIGESHAPKGAGTVMGYLGLDYAFFCLGMKSVIGEVLSSNHKSERFHLRLGFRHEGLLKNKCNSEGQSIDVNSYSILIEEWEKHKRILNMNIIKEA